MKVDEYGLSRIILSARKKSGLTQSEVSKKTGITQGTLSKIESYQCSVSAKHWFLLSKLLDIPADSVWSGVIERKGRPRLQTTGNPFKLPKKYLNEANTSVREIAPIIKIICEKFGKAEFESFIRSQKVSDLFFIDYSNLINSQFVMDLMKRFYPQDIPDDILTRLSALTSTLTPDSELDLKGEKPKLEQRLTSHSI
ncbi:helix-turn-helix domain-containing protein [Halobacteriovorax marinus]|nr:helix-turn-helix transcriptional regulator [Halobacteriovorax marinus]